MADTRNSTAAVLDTVGGSNAVAANTSLESTHVEENFKEHLPDADEIMLQAKSTRQHICAYRLENPIEDVEIPLNLVNHYSVLKDQDTLEV